MGDRPPPSCLHRSRAGYTLLELLMVLLLTTVVVLTVGKNFLDFSRAYSSLTKLLHLKARAQTVMDRLLEELVTGKFTSLAPAVPFESNSIGFQKIVTLQSGEPVYGNPHHIDTVPMESDGNDGLDNDQNGLVDECGILIWEDLPPYGSVPAGSDQPAVITERLIKNGLKFTRQGSILLIDMTLQEVIEPGQAAHNVRLLSGVKMRNS